LDIKKKLIKANI